MRLAGRLLPLLLAMPRRVQFRLPPLALLPGREGRALGDALCERDELLELLDRLLRQLLRGGRRGLVGPPAEEVYVEGELVAVPVAVVAQVGNFHRHLVGNRLAVSEPPVRARPANVVEVVQLHPR